MTLAKVKGHTHLFKDTKTGAVINNNKEALQAAKEAKRNALAREKRIQSLEDRLNNIEKLLAGGSNKC